jgi:pimeloyl-ACP methyl ester carboxylesterase
MRMISATSNPKSSRIPANSVAAFSRAAFEIVDRISEIRAPTLVIAGDYDILILPENGRILAEKIPDAEFRSIEGAGHLFWISHPEGTYSEVAGFLDGKETLGTEAVE